MRTIAPKVWRRWRDLISRRDAALIGAGDEGELLVARVRVWVLCAVSLVPITLLISRPGLVETYIALIAMGVGLTAAYWILRVARRPGRIGGFPFITSAFDVTLISATQLAYLMQGLPSVAVNSRTTFLAYFLAIGSTCLRWDVRVSLVAGGLAIVQFLAIAITSQIVFPAWNTPDTLIYGEFVWGHVIGRLIFLVAFTVMAAAIVRHSVAQRLSSTHDALTGVYNRAFFEERLQQELQRLRRTGQPLAVAMVDIDHFKQVNDKYGHHAGDAALTAVAHLLRRSLRGSDLVARWGGEEFAIVLPDASLTDAYRKIDWLRATIAAHPVPISDRESISLTLSGGIATYPSDGLSPRELVIAADVRLLEAKRAGRDRIIVPRDEPSASRPLGVPSFEPQPIDS